MQVEEHLSARRLLGLLAAFMLGIANVSAAVAASEGSNPAVLAQPAVDFEDTEEIDDADIGKTGNAAFNAAGQPRESRERFKMRLTYGDRITLGNGQATTFIIVRRTGEPQVMGLEFEESMLDDLPYDPPFDGNNCFDINGDGEISFHDPVECAGGYQAILFFPKAIVEEAELPFTWFLLNWNPVGHDPPGIYDRPHFDFHFYILDYIERNFIRPGPCGIVVNCDDFVIATKSVPERYLHPDYADFMAVEPRMGNHLVDATAPEITGQEPFTRTFVYGSYDGKIAYYEPMITLEYLETQPNICIPLKLPAAYEISGHYPTRYCIRYSEYRKKYRITLEGFIYREAS